MRGQMKAMARPFGTLFLIALAVALVGRVGLAVMDATGTLSYDYISAADVPILDVVCSILTGSALVAFMYAASPTVSGICAKQLPCCGRIPRRSWSRSDRRRRRDPRWSHRHRGGLP